MPIYRQAKLLNISRSTLYYKPDRLKQQADEMLEKELERSILLLHQADPTAGSRMLTEKLRLQGNHIGRERVRSLMKKLGIVADTKKAQDLSSEV